MRRRVLLPAAVLCLCLLTGCWDYVELNREDIVVGIALDSAEDKKHLLSVELVAFEGGSQTGRVMTAEGDSYDECIHGIIRKLGHYPNFSHAKILLFSQEVAQRNMTGFLEWAAEDHTFPFGMLMAMVSEVPASQLLRTGSDYMPHSLSLAFMLHNDQAKGKIHANPLCEFYNATVTENAIVSIPVLTLRGDAGEPSEEESSGMSSGAENTAPDTAKSGGDSGKQHATFLGIALFQGGVPTEPESFEPAGG